LAYNGTGSFARIYNWVTDAANGVLVRADRMDTEMDGFATGLSNCITKDGQQTPIANIPFGGYKITGLGNGAAPADGVNYGQVFNSPTFTGIPAGPTAAVGTSTTQLATTAFAAALAFSSALPAIAGNDGKVPFLSGGVVNWSFIGAASQAIRVNAAGTSLEGYAPLPPTGSVIYLALTAGGF